MERAAPPRGFPAQGLLDEIRISDVALSPSQFLDVPEPHSIMLLGAGIAALWMRGRRRSWALKREAHSNVAQGRLLNR